MDILYIVDNKFRDLWGFKEIKEKLNNRNINLYFCNKYNWNLATKYINPSFIIIPHIRNGSPHFQKIVHTAYEKKIRVIVYPSEGLYYEKEHLENEFPDDLLNKIEKLFLWSDDQGKFINDKHRKKIVVTGTTRFYGKNSKKNDKIKTIGVANSGRYLSPLTGKNNLLYQIQSRQKSSYHIGYLKQEVEFADFLCKLIKLSKEINVKLIFKPHPFEKINNYKEAFPDLIIEDDPDIRVFFDKIDVCINQSSTAVIQAYALKIPVINVNNSLNLNNDYMKVFKKYIPFHLGIPINDLDELKKLLTEHNIEDLFKMNEDRGDITAINKLSPEYPTVDLVVEEIIKMKFNKTKKNFFYFFMYLMKEAYLLYNKKNLDNLFRPFKKKDWDLFKKFSL